jgi:tetratricopeptide (TPR) repeat protein
MSKVQRQKQAVPEINKSPAKQPLSVYAGICALLAFLLYINSVTYDYTVDDATVMANNKLTTAGIKAIPQILTSAYRAGFWERKEGLYRPLSVAMFAAEWQIAPKQPWLGHLINVILYILTCWLLFWLLNDLLGEEKLVVSFLATLLFTVLPVHTEVVDNIKSRDEILCFLFAIISIKFLYKWLKAAEIRFLIFSATSFFLALLSKESAITLVPVFPLVAWYFNKSTRKQLIYISSVFIVTAGIFMLIRYAVIGAVTGNYEIQLINNSLIASSNELDRLATAIMILGKYLLLLIAPFKLVFDYSYNTIPIVHLTDIKSISSLITYILLLIIAYRGIYAKKIWSFGIFFFLITIALVSNILFLIEATMAERFLYMPSFGFCIALISYIASRTNSNIQLALFKRLTSSGIYITILLYIVLLSGRTIARSLDWKDNLTLLKKDVASSPNSARIRYAYGSAILIEQALKEKDKDHKTMLLQQSVEQLEKGVSLIEDYSDAWYHLGIAYKELEDPVNAIRCLEKARSYKPFKDADGYITLGLAYGMAHQNAKAIENLNTALQMNPSSTEALNNLGLYYNDAGMAKESIEALQKAIALKPDFSKAYYNLGNTYAKTGDYHTAISQYRKAIMIDPSYGDAYNNTGNCYAAMNIADSAEVYYKKSVEIDPANVKAVINLGVINTQKGDTAAAGLWFNKARTLGAKI